MTRMPILKSIYSAGTTSWRRSRRSVSYCVLGEGFSTQFLQRKLGIQDRPNRLFDRLLRILAEDGVLESRGQEWIVAQTPSWEPTGDHLQTLRARHPQCAAELEALEACGDGLADVLTGRLDPMQLLFPDGSLELTARLYRETRPATLFNTLIERCVTKGHRASALDRPLRILEIGAGTGGTTSRVLPHLPANRASYWFTDVSPQFLDRAHQRFGDYPFVQYRNFDLDKPSQKQAWKKEPSTSSSPRTFFMRLAICAVPWTK